MILLTPNLENCFFVNNGYGKIRLDNKKNKNTQIYVEIPKREKPRAEDKKNPLCQKLIQKGRVSSSHCINPWKPIHYHIYIYIYIYIYAINKAGPYRGGKPLHP